MDKPTGKKLHHAYFISDLHLGHDKVAKIRGYSDAEDFFSQLKAAWNQEMQEHYPIYILGDVVMKKDWFPSLAELKGAKRYIMGNHDVFGYESLHEHGKVYAMVPNPRHKVVLTHYPVHPQFFTYGQKDWTNIHGHLHQEVIDDPRYVNVCIDIIGLVPKPLEVLLP